MLKNLLVILITIGVSSMGYSQDANEKNPELEKKLSFFIESDTGDLNGSKNFGIFQGNEFLFGTMYSQNFEKATWLNLYIKGAAKGGINYINTRNESMDDDPILNPDLVLNGVSGTTLGFDYLELGLAFDGYGYIALRQNLMIKAFLIVPVLPYLTICGGIEALPFHNGSKKGGTIDNPTDLDPSDSSIKLVMIGISYGTDFARNWNYTGSFQYRTHGGSTGSASSANDWAIDSAEALKVNSLFRLDNSISYKMPKYGLSFWGQVRYEVNYFVDNPLLDRRSKTVNDISIRAGLTYEIDFLKL